ncbi:AAA family ATPase [Devosia sp.]|uniref:adenylate/guanylate cyclase domain-containing protein n=1 Tax=Devosia sp. TaxID=1871048 RepID=UPI0035B457D4
MSEEEDLSAHSPASGSTQAGAFRNWLNHAGLARYREILEANDVSLKNASLLTESDLVALGLTVGARRSFLAAAAELGAMQHDALLLDQERRQLTVLFADLVDWTKRSQELDSEILRAQLERFRRFVRQVTEQYGGHVAQTLGDGVLCYFGWPRAQENGAVSAVHVALALRAGVGTLPVDPPMQLRAGIATGTVTVGGGKVEEQGLAVGEAPNLAARLLTLAEPGQVVIGPTTRGLVGGTFLLTDLGPRPLKGVAHPIAAFRVDGVANVTGRFAARAASTGVSVLLGRGAELQSLLDYCEKATSGEGQVVLMSGEAGIGKSRLLHAFEDRIKVSRPLPRFEASPLHRTSALYPVIEHLTAASGIRQDDDELSRLEKLRAILAGVGQTDATALQVIAGMLSIATGEELNVSAERHKDILLESLVSYLCAASRRSGSILIFEDLHWIDPTTEELLGLLAARCRKESILLLATSRPEYRPKWQGADGDLLIIERLDASHTAQLVQHIAGPGWLDADLQTEIVRRADGVPLFAEEITRAVLLGRERNLGAIPATLQDSLLARLEPIAHARATLQLGACIGATFDAELLDAISDAVDPTYDLIDALDARILVHTRGSAESTYRFHHSLLRDAAYESLPTARRAIVHGKIADAIERSFPERAASSPELLAHHHSLAGVVDKAVDCWLRAGKRSAARFENEEAIAHFRHGLELIPRLPPGMQRDTVELQLQHGLGTALGSQQGYTPPEVGAAFGRALELSATVGEFPERHATISGLWLYYLMRAEYDKSSPLAEEMSLHTPDREALLAASMTLSIDDFFVGKLQPALAKAETSWSLYQELREPALHHRYGMNAGVFSKDFDGFISQILGYPDRAVTSQDTAIAAALRAKDPVTIATVLAHSALVASLRSDWAATLSFAKQGIDYSKENRIFIRQVEAEVFYGVAIAHVGDLRTGCDIMQKAMADWASIGARISNCLHYTLLAQLLARLDRRDDAWAAIETGIESAESSGELLFLPEAIRVKGDLHRLVYGDDPSAELEYQRAIRQARAMEAKWWELRAAVAHADLLRSQGRNAAALHVVAPVYDWFTEGHSLPELVHAKNLIAQLRPAVVNAKHVT